MEDKAPERWRGQVRMPVALANWLKDQAAKNFRSFNGQLIELIRQAKDRTSQQ